MENEQSTLHIALTGHRPNKLGGYNIKTSAYKQLQNDLETYIEFQLEHFETIWCHSGLALGADTVWSKAILAMKQRYPERVFFHAEIPTLSQTNRWSRKSDMDFWGEQLLRADNWTIYDPEFEMYPVRKQERLVGRILNDRSRGMIDHSDILLAVYAHGSKGGTKNAINYAISKNKTIQYIDAKDYF